MRGEIQVIGEAPEGGGTGNTGCACAPTTMMMTVWRDFLGRLGAIGCTHSIGCRELFRVLRNQRPTSACLLLFMRPDALEIAHLTQR